MNHWRILLKYRFWFSSSQMRRRKWQPAPVFLPGESPGQGSLVGCCLWVTQSRTQLKWLSSSSRDIHNKMFYFHNRRILECSTRFHNVFRLITTKVALVVKSPSASAGDVRNMGSIPGLGRFPGGGHSNPLHYSCLENPMDRGAWQAHGIARVRHYLVLSFFLFLLCSVLF